MLRGHLHQIRSRISDPERPRQHHPDWGITGQEHPLRHLLCTNTLRGLRPPRRPCTRPAFVPIRQRHRCTKGASVLAPQHHRCTKEATVPTHQHRRCTKGASALTPQHHHTIRIASAPGLLRQRHHSAIEASNAKTTAAILLHRHLHLIAMSLRRNLASSKTPLTI